MQDKVYILINIYAPNKDKATCKFYKNPHRILQTEDLDCEENIVTGENPRSRSYAWSRKSSPIFCRLDYWLISNNLQDFVSSTNIIPAIKTDYAAIELIFTEANQNAKGQTSGK